MRHLGRRPIRASLIANNLLLTVQPTAQSEIFIGDDDLKTCLGRCARSHQSRWACAYHEEIAMTKPFVINIGVGSTCQCPQACGFTNNGLVDLFPKRRRPHECFVIKPCGQKIRKPIVDRHRIKRE